MRKLLLAFIPLILCQCSSMEKSVGLGVGIGAATGITAAQMAHYNTKGNLVFGIGGAVIGAAVAVLLHKDVPPEPIPIPVTNIMKMNQPPLADPEKDVILVPDKIEGDQFVEKHRVWNIKKPARWQLRNGEVSDGNNEEESSDGQ